VATLFGDGSFTPQTGHGSARLARQKSANSDIRTAAEKLAIRSRRRRERAAWAAL
jgi:hypothetical protein